ncbi:sensor histidine kinase [Clostridium taeniosporum]|uniref:histidine kinase n=1 Tax=Clostridium taeniosporum TaxID=394958 RepID=A0A1D7XJR4_9CLOT|nr:sensor histidine kinase [Clostridium taeniosporum]AOR23572.1 sensor histidine kinase [Clostridium taeniosporum]
MKSINRNPYFINIITILILVMTSIGIISFYPKMGDLAQNTKVSSPYEDYNLLREIHNSSYVLYKDLLEKEQGNNLKFSNVYIQDINSNPEEYKDDIVQKNHIENIESHVNSEIGVWEENLSRNFKNLDYLVSNKNGDIIKTNNENPLQELVSQSNSEELKKLQDIYAFYMVAQFNEEGNIRINTVYGADEFNVRNNFIDSGFRNLINTYDDTVKFNKIKDTTFIYAIPKELKYNDEISRTIEDSNININSDAIISITLIILCTILILSLLVPYKKGKEILGIKYIFRIPFEILVFIFGWAAIMCGISSCSSILHTLEGDFGKTWVGFGINSDFDWILASGINTIMWSLIIYAILAGVMFLKHIFKTGFTKYLKENLLIIKIFKRVIDYTKNIDLTDKSNKFIIKILAVNFIVLMFICIIWIFGILASIVYTVVLFVILRKYFNDIREKYEILLNATNEIAKGNLDVKINKDLGLFNPFKEEIEKIQQGFKKAVDEEVKSQKMKTELISNVSHDLKTPLTSIITYVDLLKDESISEEDRKSYVNTIDKKSQRLKFLIEDLFEVSKATSGNVKLNLVNVDIVELMRQTQIELNDKIEDSGLILKNNFSKNKIILNLDSQKTFRIFENLINNIIKYAMKNSRVYIDILEEDSYVKIILKNISEVEIDFNPDEIVERFARGDLSRNTEGSGLGLAISKSFVELQGGTFKIEVDGDLFKVIIEFKI